MNTNPNPTGAQMIARTEPVYDQVRATLPDVPLTITVLR